MPSGLYLTWDALRQNLPLRRAFVGNIIYYANLLSFSAIEGPIQILGEGIIEYVFTANNGSHLSCHGKSFFVLKCPHRLVCPQEFVSVQGHVLQFTTKSAPKKPSSLNCVVTGQTVTIGFDSACNLPFALGRHLCGINASIIALSGCIVGAKNKSLTTAQNDLLCCHFKLGHIDMMIIQQLIRR